MRKRAGIAFYVAGFAVVLFGATRGQIIPSAIAATAIPFVGCQADGQIGPVDAPEGNPRILPVEPAVAADLAFYKDEKTVGVLAPRGWHCFAIYGSNGASLFVMPGPMTGAQLMSRNWPGFAGAAIQISEISGDTSGRFEVAKIAARVFPKRQAFVRDIIDEEMEPASDFSRGPYPADRLRYRGDDVVEYQTSPRQQGLGTMSRFNSNADPIDGVAMLKGSPPDVNYLAVRLPVEQRSLTGVIIQQFEDDERLP